MTNNNQQDKIISSENKHLAKELLTAMSRKGVIYVS